MNSITITDLHGNVPNNNNKFILLHIQNPLDFLDKINTNINDQIDSIWKFNKKSIFSLLRKFNLNPLIFYPLGHIWFPNNIPNNNIFLLVNINLGITKTPLYFTKIIKYGNGYIWKPVPDTNYSYMGLVYSINQPSIDSIQTISKFIVMESLHKKNIIVQNTNMNIYNYLGNINIPSYTIDMSNNFINDTDSIDSWNTYIGKHVSLSQSKNSWMKQKNINHSNIFIPHKKNINTVNIKNNNNTKKYIIYSICIFVILLIAKLIHRSSRR